MRTILLVISPEEDEKYKHRIANALAGCRVKVYSGKIITAALIQQLAAKIKADGIISTRVDHLEKIIPLGRKKPKITDYAGSLFTNDAVPVLFVLPLRSTFVYSYGEWLMEHLCSKLTKPEKWPQASKFVWTEVDTEEKKVQLYADLNRAILAGVDIETLKGELPIIESISVTLLFDDKSTMTYAWYIQSMDDVYLMRRVCGHPVSKVLQNGKYDAAYLFAWNSPLVGYYHDTVNAMHAWYAELPKDLAFITSVFVRDSVYWKDLHEVGDRQERLEYNARDTWGTVESYITWLDWAPDWAKRNYLHEFQLVPLCHAMEMRGLRRDMDRLEEYNKQLSEELGAQYDSIQKMVGLYGWDNPVKLNPGSPKQMLDLMRVLGAKDPESSDEKSLLALAAQHPLNARILGAILEFRGVGKLLSTYLPTGKEGKEFKGQILGTFNPHGTDTGRKSSKSHHFWCGLQFQNVPEGPVKATLKAPKGYKIYEFDFSQAEARGVAYKSGDPALLAAVESKHDFHSWNASAFFGVPYEQIYQDGHDGFWDSELGKWVEACAGKVLNKPLRNLAKRVNHGANYNMGAKVLLDTMGIPAVREAQFLLKLDPSWSLIQVCEHLLLRYEQTYPRVKGIYYTKIKQDVKRTKLLVSDTGWTRYCFGDPTKNKMDLNAYVAHVTQNLNAMCLDIAHMRVESRFPVDSPDPEVLHHAQIHDSLLLSLRETHHAELADEIKSLMTFAVPVTDCTGVTRDMVVPVDAKYCGDYWLERA